MPSQKKSLFIGHASRTVLFLLLFFVVATKAQTPNAPRVAQLTPSLYQALRWRCIGPHRGGRALAVSGIRGQPETYYFGAVGGGVWKTTNAGEVWQPIFDDQPISSIELAVAPSNPNVIYVGSGEADMRSDISLATACTSRLMRARPGHILVRDTRQIGRILIDPKDADIVLVAALGMASDPMKSAACSFD